MSPPNYEFGLFYDKNIQNFSMFFCLFKGCCGWCEVARTLDVQGSIFMSKHESINEFTKIEKLV